MIMYCTIHCECGCGGDTLHPPTFRVYYGWLRPPAILYMCNPLTLETYSKAIALPTCPLTRSNVVFSRMSTIFSSLVLSVKRKSSSTHSTYLVVTCETARFLPANQP